MPANTAVSRAEGGAEEGIVRTPASRMVLATISNDVGRLQLDVYERRSVLHHFDERVAHDEFIRSNATIAGEVCQSLP